MSTATVDLSSVTDTQPQDFGESSFESPEVDQGGSQSDQQSSESGSEGQSTTGEQSADGRRGPQNIRQSIKAASEALPEQAAHFKELGNAYFREQAYKQHFATPQEAASAKSLIEGVGGLDGIAQIQERIQGYDTQEAGLESGDPAVLDSFFEDYPEGAKQLAPHYLDKLQKLDPQAFAATVAPHAIAMLDQAGIGGFLDAIQNEADPQRAKAMVQQLAQWYAQQKNGVQQTRQQAQKNPAEDRIRQQQEQLQQQQEQIFSERVQEKVTSKVTPEIDKVVNQYGKQNNWNDDQKAEFRTKLQNDIIAQMKVDETYGRQVELRKANKGRTPDTIADYISSEFVRRVNAKEGAFTTASKVRKLFGQGQSPQQQPTGVVKAGQPNTSSSGGPLYVSQRPQDSDFADYPGLAMDIIQGRARLKSGRFVTWRK